MADAMSQHSDSAQGAEFPVAAEDRDTRASMDRRISTTFFRDNPDVIDAGYASGCNYVRLSSTRRLLLRAPTRSEAIDEAVRRTFPNLKWFIERYFASAPDGMRFADNRSTMQRFASWLEQPWDLQPQMCWARKIRDEFARIIEGGHDGLSRA